MVITKATTTATTTCGVTITPSTPISTTASSVEVSVRAEDGSGVAMASDGMCKACHVRMRVQIWVEVRKNEQIFQCESCSRVLFYEPPPPTVAVEP